MRSLSRPSVAPTIEFLGAFDPRRPRMLAADSMPRTAKPGMGIPGGHRIRCLRGMAFVKLGFRQRSAQEPRREGGKADFVRWMSCFKDPMGKGKKVEVEKVRGGEDLWDAAAMAERGSFPEHLVIMVNGLVGSAEDWRFAAEQFVKKLPNKVIVHRSECNTSRLTFDGVDLMGERLAEEVRSVVKQRGGVRKISFVAHSLGGLVARYAIGRLYELPPADAKDQFDEEGCLDGRIAGLEPMNFITFASPHLGSRGHKQIPFLCGLPFLERRASETAHLIVGRTGKHLFLTDNDDGRPPLLLRMVDDCDDVKFRSALRSFKRRVAYANANYDHIVGWRTSSIRRQHELPKHHLLVEDEKYPHIVFADKGNAEIKLNEDVESQKYDLEGEELLVEL
ncbi:putative lipase ROG1 isoform X2 [Phoenix dactylifera]|uniref:Lipase ROG1 isoform X2 n=1 Tax=Phoenix dactylifera TaxID=42345 RepID=A0A8B7CSB3_PHODC|nr:putative lipase ROG1 isoform X2 [Phoenix dactylifera]